MTSSPGGTTSGGTPTSTPTSTSAAPSSGVPQGVANAVAALQTAAAAVPNGQPFDLERDTYQGQRVWDIKVASNGNQFNLYVSEDGSTVVSQEQDATPDDDVQKLQSAQISAVEAVERVAREHGGTLKEMEIDSTDDGTVVWQVEIAQSDGSEVEVDLNASTGEVVQTSGD
ncbi:PepSY domain-containing protein [Geodermatophilus sp. TF02-6]|uniref:PepSY domain-containing protein n=1 Tax=Geodermatophilus sp. TF02-6 TaxID=2250575 RepID=UPI0011BE592E|nr:PepSY domain-containing protein [Geodermatophilus sp. TF02-6]